MPLFVFHVTCNLICGNKPFSYNVGNDYNKLGFKVEGFEQFSCTNGYRKISLTRCIEMVQIRYCTCTNRSNRCLATVSFDL